MSQDPVTGTGPTDTNPVAAPGAPETDLVKVDSPVASAPEWVAPMIRRPSGGSCGWSSSSRC